jgi:deoxyribose-phosphate aldolase
MLEARSALLAQRAIRGEAKSAALDLLVAAMDLSSAGGIDSPGRVRALCARAESPAPGLPSVAAVTVDASLVDIAKEATRGTSLKVAALVKPADARAAVDSGADEIELAIDRGAFLAGDEAAVYAEIGSVRELIGNAVLKVSIEAAELGSYRSIRRAAQLALDAGADFVRSASSRNGGPVTPPVALLLCETVREHVRATGRTAGVKISGGVRTTKAALVYLAIVKETLGNAWLLPDRFRIGGSSLLDDILLQSHKEAIGAYAGRDYVATA